MKKLLVLFVTLATAFCAATGMCYADGVATAEGGTASAQVAPANDGSTAATIVSAPAKRQKTSKAYKKYVGKWVTVNYTLKVKVINKNYLKATLKTKKGDYVTIDKKIKNVTKKHKLRLVSKKGVDVVVTIQFKYGKPYREYGGAKVVDGPKLHITGGSAQWCKNDMKVKKKGKWTPVFIVYQKYL